jgi:hypothetical protein
MDPGHAHELAVQEPGDDRAVQHEGHAKRGHAGTQDGLADAKLHKIRRHGVAGLCF